MSTNNRQSNRIKDQSGFAKPLVVIIIVIVLVVAAALGYFAFAKSKDMWPYGSNSINSTGEKVSVEISKLAFEGDGVLSVNIKLHNVEDDGHCVLTVSSKTAVLTIDDSKAERSAEAQKTFKDCTGWNVGAKDLPSGEYNVEVKFVGPSGELTTTKKVTKE